MRQYCYEGHTYRTESQCVRIGQKTRVNFVSLVMDDIHEDMHGNKIIIRKPGYLNALAVCGLVCLTLLRKAGVLAEHCLEHCRRLRDGVSTD